MKTIKSDEMRPEYKREDLGEGKRGKYFNKYQKGSNVVLLSPDVAAVFHDEDSVNDALRDLIKVARHSVKLAKRSGR